MTDTYTRIRNEVMAGGTDDPNAGAPVGGVRAALGLGVIAALLVWLALVNIWMLVFVVGLLVSIFLHEVGHFVTARWTGMKATQFFLFMGPKLWSFRRGETEYGIRAYPLGAFVRIIGMNNLDEVDDQDAPRAYRNKSFPRRLLVITAGSIMHMIIAIALLFGVYAVNGRREAGDLVRIGTVVAGSPAAAAGVRNNDLVLGIDGQTPTRGEQFIDIVRGHRPGDVISLVVAAADGGSRTLSVTLGENPNVAGAGYLGVSSGTDSRWSQESVASAARHSITDLGTTMWQSVGGVVKVANPLNIIRQLTDSDADPQARPSTVVGVTQFSSEIGADLGIGGMLMLLAGFNVFVGLFNLIPLLPFDGGHAAMAIYERLRSKPGRMYHADVRKLIPLSMVTVGFLAFLFSAALYLDLVKPVR